MPPNGRGHSGSHAGDVDPNNLPQNFTYAGQVKQQAIQQVEAQYHLQPGDTGFAAALEKAIANVEGTVQAQQKINQQQTTLASDVGTRDAPTIGDNNYMSYSHDALYSMVNTTSPPTRSGRAASRGTASATPWSTSARR